MFKTLVLVPAFAIALASSGCANKCAKCADGAGNQASAQDPHANLNNLAVNEVSDLVAAKKAVAVDANGQETRTQFGTIPGAILLTDAHKYNVSELPADKATKLVFYCGGPKCMSAPAAAEQAIKAGYTDVHVMRDGIKGWVSAGKQVSK